MTTLIINENISIPSIFNSYNDLVEFIFKKESFLEIESISDKEDEFVKNSNVFNSLFNVLNKI